MKTIRDVMTAEVVWISPSARVKTAIILMKGHNVAALPVVHTDDKVVGIVTRHRLLGEANDAAIEDVMDRNIVIVDPDMSIHDASDEMNKTGVSHLLVMENDRLVGIVSRSDLLLELGKTFDPLTELPWSDTFRQWAMNALKSRKEISVIFFDLDLFGTFNKKYGHVVGDTVLKQVAEVIKNSVDNHLDLACRYGGDEFAIVSIRLRDEAKALAETLQERVSKIKIDELPEGISITYGMYGGRRTKEREDMHYAATIDDLITRASKECTAHKPHRADKEAPAGAAKVQPKMPTLSPSLMNEGTRAPRLKIGTVSISTSGPEAKVSVILERGGIEFSRDARGYALGGKNVLRLIAEATAGAVCKSIEPGHGIVVDEVLIQNLGAEDECVTVIATFISPKFSSRQAGSAVMKRGDQYHASAAALLAAVNRLLETTPQAIPDDFDLSLEATEI